MDPDAIAALNDPTTLQDDEDSEDSDDKQHPQVKEPDEEEEPEEESEEEQDPNPTTAKEQTIPENVWMTISGRISKPPQVKFSTYVSHIYRLKPIKKCHAPSRLPVSLQSPCATSVPRSKTSVIKKPFNSSRLTA
jgi:CO dehydrogenase/acetyl-CoA synthase beta subunit